MAPMLFQDVPKGPVDVMFQLKQYVDNDTSPEKIDVGAGMYRSNKPGYHEFQAIAKAKTLLQQQPADHEYNETTGIRSFVDAAAGLVFGEQSQILQSHSVASVQTVGGTGAVRLGAAFLNRNFPSYSAEARLPNPTKVYVGAPAWPNYVPLFRHAGFHVETFRHYDTANAEIDMNAALSTINAAPNGSIFILQVCCHNPTGQDYSPEQWIQLADAIQARSHYAFFDMAYQGFAVDMETDAWPVRYFAEREIDFLVCQSFSKHMGLYAERIGALHVACKSAGIATNVKDQLRSLTRWEVSSTPAYGAKLADIIMHSSSLRQLWLQEVQQACDRMITIRRTLYELLTTTLQAPGSFEHILEENGLFSYFKLDRLQVQRLRESHIYLAESGRINVAGLNDGNVEAFALAVKKVLEEDLAENDIANTQSRL